MIARIAALLIFCTAVQISFAQDIPKPVDVTLKKGRFYAYWGWNRGWYTQSDITFKGDSYDFTLSEVVAKDRQSKFTLEKYFSPTHLTIPQYNFRFGMFLNEKYDVSFGIDHMKYVAVQNQTVKINGEINDTDSGYDGLYNDEEIGLAYNFLQYEHTDGLNFLNFELRRNDDIFSVGKFTFTFFEGVGVSALTPRSDVSLLNFDNQDEFHLAGFGLGISLGGKIQFARHFFVQSEWKGGYVNLLNVRTTPSKSDSAHQDFLYSQWNVVFGSSFRFGKG